MIEDNLFNLENNMLPDAVKAMKKNTKLIDSSITQTRS